MFKNPEDKMLKAIFGTRESIKEEKRLEKEAKIIHTQTSIISVLEKLVEMFGGGEIIEKPSKKDVECLMEYKWKSPIFGKVQLEDGTLLGISKYFSFDTVTQESLMADHLMVYQDYSWQGVSIQ